MSEVHFFNKFDKKLGATSPALLNDSGAVQAAPPRAKKYSQIMLMYFGGIAFLREVTRLNCYFASLIAEFRTTLARCLNQSCVSAVFKSNLIAVTSIG